ncbi:MAG TPA: hypothetical protein VL084_02115 [Thermoanaerobaculia bacterium]|nr:hypothetical protein [Thermoanaerobaculia bacterium]
MRRHSAAASLALFALLMAIGTAPLLAGVFETRLRLPLRPKLAVTGRERISIAPFLIASRTSDKREAVRLTSVDLDAEFRRYLGKLLSKRTKMTLVAMPPDVTLPAGALKELAENTTFWRGLGARTGADLLLSGVVDFRVENKSGYRTEEYRSPVDNKIYTRQVLIESTGFTFDVSVLALDGRTGARLFLENFRDQKEKPKRAADEMAGLFENLYSLEGQLLGLFVVREREANRYVFD